jgi:hypothetical protein
MVYFYGLWFFFGLTFLCFLLIICFTIERKKSSYHLSWIPSKNILVDTNQFLPQLMLLENGITTRMQLTTKMKGFILVEVNLPSTLFNLEVMQALKRN